jgi:peptidyl-prolyl cis-trans isomerase SurA
MMRVVIVSIFFTLLFYSEGLAVLLDRIVAVVNDDVITLSELNAMELSVLQNSGKRPGQEGFELDRERLLNELIDKKIKLQKAAELNIKVSQEQVNLAVQQILEKNEITEDAFKEKLRKEGFTWSVYKKEISEQMVLSRLMNEEVRSRIFVMPDELEEYYQEHRDRFGLDEKKHLLRILLSVPESATEEEREAREIEAEALRVRLLSGEDFHQIAIRYSDGPEAREGGDLGYFSEGELREELNREISGMRPSEISRVIPLEKGFVLFKVDDVRASSHVPFEEIKDKIQEAIYQEKLRTRYETWISELKSKAYIERKL